MTELKSRKGKGMKGCQSLDELSDHFQLQLDCVKQLLQLRRCESDNRCSHVLGNIESSVQELETMVTLMRAELCQRRRALDKVESLRKQVQDQDAQLQHMIGHLPERLPSKHSVPTPRSPGFVSKAMQPQEPPSSSSKKSKVSKEPMASQFIPSLEYLTVEEYEAVPKYIKGRTTYIQANAAVEEFNKALTCKYKVLFTPKAGRTDHIKKQIAAYKKQETKDTKGIHFVVEEDLKQLSNYKLDPAGRKLLTALRHCGRIKEIRGSGLTRLAVCQ